MISLEVEGTDGQGDSTSGKANASWSAAMAPDLPSVRGILSFMGICIGTVDFPRMGGSHVLWGAGDDGTDGLVLGTAGSHCLWDSCAYGT